LLLLSTPLAHSHARDMCITPFFLSGTRLAPRAANLRRKKQLPRGKGPALVYKCGTLLQAGQMSSIIEFV
jgi:hypothetical protein